MFKLLKWLVVAVVLLIVLALVGVWIGVNAAVRKAVEMAATSGLQTTTTVGGATVSPFGGSVSLSDVAVNSPEGFSSPQMFKLGRVGVSSSVGNLFGEPVKITEVTVAAPQLVIEQSGGKLNVLALSQKLKGDNTPKPSDPNAKSMKLVIGKLDLTDASVTIVPGIPGVDKTYQVKLPAVSLNNIGNADGNQNGEELSRVLNTIVATMAAKAADSDQVPEAVRALLKLDVRNVADQLQGQAKEEIDKVTGKLGSELGKLLENKKK